MRPLRWHSPEHNLVIWSFAKAGSQIIQKLFAESSLKFNSLDIDFRNRRSLLNEEEIISNNLHWIMIRDHQDRVLSTYYEKQLSWHGRPNNNVATWGLPCTYIRFLETNLPQRINGAPNRHVIPYTSFLSVEKTNFDKIYFMNQVDELVDDFCKLTGLEDKEFKLIANEKLFHSIPYIKNEKAIKIVNNLSGNLYELSPEEINDKRLYFRKNIMNNDYIAALLRTYYEKDFEKFPELKF